MSDLDLMDQFDDDLDGDFDDDDLDELDSQPVVTKTPEFLPMEERQAVKIRKSRIEIGANIATSYVVPAAIKMEGRQVSREIDPTGDSVIEYTDRDEAEAAIIVAGFRPVY